MVLRGAAGDPATQPAAGRKRLLTQDQRDRIVVDYEHLEALGHGLFVSAVHAHRLSAPI
jgi:hypothetical protein